MPFLPRISTVAPSIGLPVLIDIRKTSLLPSVFFFVRIPTSVMRRNLLSLTEPIGFFVTGFQPRAVRKKRPRSLPPSAGLRNCSEKSNAE